MLTNPDRVRRVLQSGFGAGRIGVVGDLMLDRYLWGTCTRLSPEAPVPVVELQRSTSFIGGAANVARNLASLGIRTELFGYVGVDSAGSEVIEACRTMGVGHEGIVPVPGYPTTVKTRVLVENRQMIRLDEEDRETRKEHEVSQLLDRLRSGMEAEPMAAVIVSDYAKGVVSETLCQEVVSLCRERGTPVFVDPKGTNAEKYRRATCVKPNRSEMVVLAGAKGWPADPIAAARCLLGDLELDYVVLTLGSEGMVLVTPQGAEAIPAINHAVFDVSGAGDTVIATMVAASLGELPIRDAVEVANLAASMVVAQVGTSAVTRAELLKELDRIAPDRHAPVKNDGLDAFIASMSRWPVDGLPTSGAPLSPFVALAKPLNPNIERRESAW